MAINQKPETAKYGPGTPLTPDEITVLEMILGEGGSMWDAEEFWDGPFGNTLRNLADDGRIHAGEDYNGRYIITITPAGNAAYYQATMASKSTTGATEVKQMLEEKVKVSSYSFDQLSGVEADFLSLVEDEAQWLTQGDEDQHHVLISLGYIAPTGMQQSVGYDAEHSILKRQYRITQAGVSARIARDEYIMTTFGGYDPAKSTKSALSAKLDQKIEKQVEKFVDPEEWDYLVRMQRGAGISVENPNGPFAYNLAVAQRLLQKGLIKLDGPSEFDPSGVSMVYSLTDAGIAVLMANNKATK